MRTSVLDVLVLAWRLLAMRKWRKHQRIGQILVNSSTDVPFYIENGHLLQNLKNCKDFR